MNPRAAADAAWRETVRFAAATRWFRPVSSVQLNVALRRSHSYAEWRRACSESCRADSVERMALAQRALRMAFEHGVQHAWSSAGKRRTQALMLQSHDAGLSAYVLSGLMLIEYVDFAANAFVATVSHVPDDDWNEAVEQQHFECWKAQVLRRRIWPPLPPETLVTLVRPVIDLTFHAGLYLALQARWPAVLWRYRPGRHCRRHDADRGLTAPPDDAVWTNALPPRAFFCDCTIEGVRELGLRQVPPPAACTNAPASPTCAFFAGDRRRGAVEFLDAYIARMKASCHEDESDCGGDAKSQAP